MMGTLIAGVEDFVREELKQVDPSHDWRHICRVRKSALTIYKEEQAAGRFLEADELVVEIAALMHDVGDFKYSGDHSVGPRKVMDFLSGFANVHLSKEQIEKIVSIVGNISFRHETSHSVDVVKLPDELRIVQDADRLDAIGAIGIGRCFAFSGARNRPFYNAEGGDSATAYDHFFEKLFKLKSMMKTETGRNEALRRHAFMVQFIEELEYESGLPSCPKPE
jgi:uncharacterized protein